MDEKEFNEAYEKQGFPPLKKQGFPPLIFPPLFSTSFDEGWVGPRYKHLALSDGRRGTVCFAISPDRKKIQFGLALCSKQDSFTRARGRQISFGRMMSPRTREFVLLNDPLSKSNFRSMLNTVYLLRNIAHLVSE